MRACSSGGRALDF